MVGLTLNLSPVAGVLAPVITISNPSNDTVVLAGEASATGVELVPPSDVNVQLVPSNVKS